MEVAEGQDSPCKSGESCGSGKSGGIGDEEEEEECRWK